MNRNREEIEELRRRVQQNERHMGEMDWALLRDTGELPALPSDDPRNALLRAQNIKLKAQIEKLEAVSR